MSGSYLDEMNLYTISHDIRYHEPSFCKDGESPLYSDNVLRVIDCSFGQGKIKEFFYGFMIHSESDIVGDIDSWTHPRLKELETIYDLLLKAHKMSRLGIDDRLYLYASLLDHSSIYKH